MRNVPMMECPDGMYRADNGSVGNITAKTAAYTLKTTDVGKTFTNRGASGSVTFTLPSVASSKAGMWYRIMKCTPGQNIVIAANSHTIIGHTTPFTGTTALTHSTANERGSVTLIYDGTAWIVENMTGTWTIS